MKKLLQTACLLLLSPALLAANAGLTVYNPETAGDTANQASDQSLTLNSSMFGLKGPLSIGTIYSKNYGVILKGQYTKRLGLHNAISLLGELGAKQRRLNLTWGFLVSQNQRIKLTLERLEQKMDFDFASGDTKQWDAQNAFGATYEYILKKGWLNDINLNAFYSRADSRSLSNKIYSQSGTNFLNYRRIAGGTDKSLSAGVDLFPTNRTDIGLQLNYDNVHYNMKYEKSTENTSGLGLTVSLKQIMSKHLKLDLLASDRKTYDTYQVGLDIMAPSPHGTSLEIQPSIQRTINHNGTRNDTIVGVEGTLRWGQADNTDQGFTLNRNALNGDLAGWTATPAVEMQQVLAVKDEKSVQYFGLNKPSPNALKSTAPQTYTIYIHANEHVDLKLANYFHKNNMLQGALAYQAKTLPSGWTLKNGELQASLPSKLKSHYAPILVAASEIHHSNMLGETPPKFIKFNLTAVSSIVLPNPGKAPPLIGDLHFEKDQFSSYTFPLVRRDSNPSTLFVNIVQPFYPVNEVRVLGLPPGVTASWHFSGDGEVTISGTPTTDASYNISVEAKSQYDKIWSPPISATVIVGPQKPVHESDPASVPLQIGDHFTTATAAPTYGLGKYFDPKDGLNFDNAHTTVTKQGGGTYTLADLGLSYVNSGGVYNIEGHIASSIPVGTYDISFNAGNEQGWSDAPAVQQLVISAGVPTVKTASITGSATAGQTYTESNLAQYFNANGGTLSFDDTKVADVYWDDAGTHKLISNIGLSITSGNLTGTVATEGTYNIYFKATNSAGTSANPVHLTLTVNAGVPTVKTASITGAATAGQTYTESNLAQYFNANGGTLSFDDTKVSDVYWDDAGTHKLISNIGLSITSDNLTGTVAAEGTYNIYFKATNSAGTSANPVHLTLTVNAGVPTVKTASITGAATAGQTYTESNLAQYFNANGGTLSFDDTKVSDVYWDDNGTHKLISNIGLSITSDNLTGTVAAEGTYNIYFKATNSAGTSANPVHLTLTVNAGVPTVKTASITGTATAGQAYTESNLAQYFNANGGTLTFDDTKVADVYWDDNGTHKLISNIGLSIASGNLTGTVATEGTYNIYFKATNSAGTSANPVHLTLTVNAGVPTVKTASITGAATAGQTYTESNIAQYFNANGGTLTFDDTKVSDVYWDDNGTHKLISNIGLSITGGNLTGTVAAEGTYNIYFKATNSAGTSANPVHLTLTVNAGVPTVKTASISNTATAGQTFTQSNIAQYFNANGGTLSFDDTKVSDVYWDDNGTHKLISNIGLSITGGNLTGTVAAEGTYNIYFKATNSAGTSANPVHLTLTVNAGVPTVKTASISNTATAGQTFTQSNIAQYFNANGGTLSFDDTKVSDVYWDDNGTHKLISNIGLSITGGNLTGTVAAEGTYNIYFKATNSAGTSANPVHLTLTVNAGVPTVKTASITGAATAGQTYTESNLAQYFNANGGTLTFDDTKVSDVYWDDNGTHKLISNIGLNITSGNLTGTVATEGTYNIYFKATNSAGTSANPVHLTLTVNAGVPTVKTASISNTATAGQTFTQSNIAQYFNANGGTLSFDDTKVSDVYWDDNGTHKLISNIGLSITGGNLTGTVAAEGTYNIYFKATNSAGTSANPVHLTLTVNAGVPTVKTASITGAATAGQTYTESNLAQYFNANGGTLSFDDTKAADVYWDDAGTHKLISNIGLSITSGNLTGTIAAEGTYNIYFKATNSAGTSVNPVHLTLTVNAGVPTVKTASITGAATAGQTYTESNLAQYFNANGGTLSFDDTKAADVYWDDAGTHKLISNIGLSITSGNLTGTIAAEGTYNIYFKATNSAGTSVNPVHLTLTVNAGVPTVKTASITGAATAGHTYTESNLAQYFNANGGTLSFDDTKAADVYWDDAGTHKLISNIGLSITSGNLTGTIAAEGTYNIYFKATNSAGTSVNPVHLTLTVNAGVPTVKTASITGAATAGHTYTESNLAQYFNANGGTLSFDDTKAADVYWDDAGTHKLISNIGLSITSGNLTGTVATEGTYNIYFKATNSAGTSANPVHLTLTVSAGVPTVKSASITGAATAGQTYTESNLAQYFNANGGTLSFDDTKVTDVYWDDAGTHKLISNIGLSITSGNLTGTVATEGTYNIYFKATNSAGTSANPVHLTLTVNAGVPTVKTASISNTATAGQTFTQSNIAQYFNANGGTLSFDDTKVADVYWDDNGTHKLISNIGLSITSGNLTGTVATEGTYNIYFKATNSAGTSANPVHLTLTVNAGVPTVKTASISNTAAAGQSFTQSNIAQYFNANGGTLSFDDTKVADVYWDDNGTHKLISNIGLNITGGNLTGTIAAEGTYNIYFKASNSAGTSANPVHLTLTVSAGVPTIKTASITGAATAGQTYTESNLAQYFNANGGTLSFDDTKVADVYWDDNGTHKLISNIGLSITSGNLTGTIATEGTYNIYFKATNSAGTSANPVHLTLTVNAGEPTVKTASITGTATAGQTYTESNLAQYFNANGGTLSFDDTKVADVYWDDNGTHKLISNIGLNITGGNLTGTIAAEGTYNIYFKATNSAGTSANPVHLTLTVSAGVPTVKTASITGTATAGQAYTESNLAQYFNANGGTLSFDDTKVSDVYWDDNGTHKLISNIGLSITSDNLTGTVAAEGTYNIYFKATNSAGTSANPVHLTLTVNAGVPTVKTASITGTATAGQAYTESNLAQYFNANGGTLTFDDTKVADVYWDDNGTHKLISNIGLSIASGNLTGTVATEGTYNIYFKATNSAGTSANPVHLTLTVNAGVPTVKTASISNTATAGQTFTQSNIAQYFNANGGTLSFDDTKVSDVYWDDAGTHKLISNIGLSITSGNLTGTVATEGTYNIYFKATNSAGTSANPVHLTLTVNAGVPTVKTASISNTATAGQTFTQSNIAQYFNANGGTLSFDDTKVSDVYWDDNGTHKLISNIGLSITGGNLTGTVAAEGTYNIYFKATNSAGTSANPVHLTLTVNAGIPTVKTASITGTVMAGQTYTQPNLAQYFNANGGTLSFDDTKVADVYWDDNGTHKLISNIGLSITGGGLTGIVTTAGTYNIYFKASNSAGTSANPVHLTLTVNAAPAPTPKSSNPVSLPSTHTGASYSINNLANYFDKYTASSLTFDTSHIEVVLPNHQTVSLDQSGLGLALVHDGNEYNITGTIPDTLTNGAGHYSFEIKAGGVYPGSTVWSKTSAQLVVEVTPPPAPTPKPEPQPDKRPAIGNGQSFTDNLNNHFSSAAPLSFQNTTADMYVTYPGNTGTHHPLSVLGLTLNKANNTLDGTISIGSNDPAGLYDIHVYAYNQTPPNGRSATPYVIELNVYKKPIVSNATIPSQTKTPGKSIDNVDLSQYFSLPDGKGRLSFSTSNITATNKDGGTVPLNSLGSFSISGSTLSGTLNSSAALGTYTLAIKAQNSGSAETPITPIVSDNTATMQLNIDSTVKFYCPAPSELHYNLATDTVTASVTADGKTYNFSGTYGKNKYPSWSSESPKKFWTAYMENGTSNGLQCNYTIPSGGVFSINPTQPGEIPSSAIFTKYGKAGVCTSANGSVTECEIQWDQA